MSKRILELVACAALVLGVMQLPVMAQTAAVDFKTGMEALQKGDYTKAANTFETMNTDAPGNTLVLTLLGMSREGLKDMRAAQRNYEAAVRNDPRNVEARRQLALLYAKTDQKPKAETELGRLKDRQRTCANTCPESAVIQEAVRLVETAIAAPPAAATPAAK